MLVALSPREASAFVARLHYSGSCRPGLARYGWLLDGELVGATVFNQGLRSMRVGVFGAEHFASVLHHHRLAVADWAPKGTASRLMAASLRQLRKDRPGTKAVVSYADSCWGHTGVVYQALSAAYTGLHDLGALEFLDAQGHPRSTRSLKGDWPERRRQAAELGWSESRCDGKHRYVLLGPRRSIPELRWKTEPYPRRVLKPLESAAQEYERAQARLEEASRHLNRLIRRELTYGATKVQIAQRTGLSRLTVAKRAM